MIQHFGKVVGQRIIDPQEPVVAWRSWRLANWEVEVPELRWWWQKAAEPKAPPSEKFLASMSVNVTWSGTMGLVAVCGRERNDRCLGGLKRECTCGIWGSKRLENLASHGCALVSPVGVVGRVNLWGFAWEYEHGFRASVGYPRDLWLGCHTRPAWADSLAKYYKVEVHTGMPAVEGVELGTLVDGPQVRAGD